MLDGSGNRVYNVTYRIPKIKYKYPHEVSGTLLQKALFYGLAAMEPQTDGTLERLC